MGVRAVDLVDVLVHLVVLGLFIQFLPQVISESFLVALLTAVLLKVVLEVVVRAKKAVITHVRTTSSPFLRAVGLVALVCVMAGSKFLVLELTALFFGDAVHLGGFFAVTALVVCLMLARAGTRAFLLPATAASDDDGADGARRADGRGDGGDLPAGGPGRGI